VAQRQIVPHRRQPDGQIAGSIAAIALGRPAPHDCIAGADGSARAGRARGPARPGHCLCVPPSWLLATGDHRRGLARPIRV